MGVEFYFPTVAAPSVQWIPLKQPEYPAQEPVDYPGQLIAETASGRIYVQDKGQRAERFILTFDRISQADRNNALTLFNTVKKAANTFEYLDRDQNLHTVRWLNGFDFQLVILDRWSGSIELLKENA